MDKKDDITPAAYTIVWGNFHRNMHILVHDPAVWTNEQYGVLAYLKDLERRGLITLQEFQDEAEFWKGAQAE